MLVANNFKNYNFVLLYLAGRGASQGQTQGQVAPGPDLAAVRIPVQVPASQVPVRAVPVHHLRERISPAPLTGNVI